MDRSCPCYKVNAVNKFLELIFLCVCKDCTSLWNKGNDVIQRYTLSYVLDPHNGYFTVFKDITEILAWIHWMKAEIFCLRVLRYDMPRSPTNKLDLQWSCGMIRVTDVA